MVRRHVGMFVIDSALAQFYEGKRSRNSFGCFFFEIMKSLDESVIRSDSSNNESSEEDSAVGTSGFSDE